MRGWWSAAAPLACGIHCVITPLASLMLPAAGLVPDLELWLFGCVLALGGVTLIRAIRIGIVLPALIFSGAMAGVGVALLTGEVFGELVTGGAYLTGALALLFNARAMHAAECHAAERCAATVAEPAS
jgi:hypothetical protein